LKKVVDRVWGIRYFGTVGALPVTESASVRHVRQPKKYRIRHLANRCVPGNSKNCVRAGRGGLAAMEATVAATFSQQRPRFHKLERTRPWVAANNHDVRVPGVYLTSAFLAFLYFLSERRMNNLTYVFAMGLMVRSPPPLPKSQCFDGFPAPRFQKVLIATTWMRSTDSGSGLDAEHKTILPTSTNSRLSIRVAADDGFRVADNQLVPIPRASH